MAPILSTLKMSVEPSEWMASTHWSQGGKPFDMVVPATGGRGGLVLPRGDTPPQNQPESPESIGLSSQSIAGKHVASDNRFRNQFPAGRESAVAAAQN
jgi:hypothetical protein